MRSLDDCAQLVQSRLGTSERLCSEARISVLLVPLTQDAEPSLLNLVLRPDITSPTLRTVGLPGHGYGVQTLRQVAESIRAAGATELLTSYVEAPGGPADFYTRLGCANRDRR